jgi:beta-lactamase class A
MIIIMWIVLLAGSAVFTETAAQGNGKPTHQEKPVPIPTTSAVYQALLEQISHIAQVSKGEVGVAAIDLRTGSRVEFNANEAVSLASTFKVPLAAYAMHLAEQEKLSLTEPVHVKRKTC